MYSILFLQSMTTIKSIRGKDQLLLDGFRYRQDREAWRCVKDKCKGRIRFDGTKYEVYSDHVCQAPNPNEIEKALYMHEIRKKAEETNDIPRSIIRDARVKLSSDAAAFIPQYVSSQRAIQRLRKGKDIPKEPKSFSDIIIPPRLQITLSNQSFLLYDNNDNNKRLLVFASKEQLDLLNGSDSWHCDGTFAVCESTRSRRFSIH